MCLGLIFVFIIQKKMIAYVFFPLLAIASSYICPLPHIHLQDS